MLYAYVLIQYDEAKVIQLSQNDIIVHGKAFQVLSVHDTRTSYQLKLFQEIRFSSIRTILRKNYRSG